MTKPTDRLLVNEGTRLLHIGPYKTGTTALQAAFHLARENAERQGVHYSGYGRQWMTAVTAVLGKPSPWSPEGKPPSIRFWRLLARDIRASKARCVVLSSEVLSDADGAAIRRVVDDLGPGQVHVAVTLRPLARVLPSQWQQYVQNRLTISFDDWVEAVLNQPRGSVTPSFWYRHRHDELVARWAEVVGASNVTVVALDERDRGMLFRVFEQLCGLTPGTLVPDPDLSNRSMTLAEIEVVRAFNVAFKAARLPPVLYQRVMRKGAAPLIELRKPDADEGRVELPPWAIEPVAEIARQIITGIRASGARVVGDLEALASVTTSRGPEPLVARPTPEVAASVAMGVLIASGLARGTGLPARATADDDDAAALPPAPRPISEPPELFRVSTLQLAVVFVRRVLAGTRDRIGRSLRRS